MERYYIQLMIVTAGRHRAVFLTPEAAYSYSSVSIRSTSNS